MNLFSVEICGEKYTVERIITEKTLCEIRAARQKDDRVNSTTEYDDSLSVVFVGEKSNNVIYINMFNYIENIDTSYELVTCLNGIFDEVPELMHSDKTVVCVSFIDGIVTGNVYSDTICDDVRYCSVKEKKTSNFHDTLSNIFVEHMNDAEDFQFELNDVQ